MYVRIVTFERFLRSVWIALIFVWMDQNGQLPSKRDLKLKTKTALQRTHHVCKNEVTEKPLLHNTSLPPETFSSVHHLLPLDQFAEPERDLKSTIVNSVGSHSIDTS